MITPTPAITHIIGVRRNSRQGDIKSLPPQHASQRQSSSICWDLVRPHHPETPDITTAISASIPLPAWHVQKTRSEIQLDDCTRQAEYEDARLCIRLVAGMQTQCIANGGIVHPKTRHCLREVLRTKAAKDEREMMECRIKGEERVVDLVLTDTTITLRSFSAVTPPCDNMNNMSTVEDTEEQDNDDDCVFSLEL